LAPASVVTPASLSSEIRRSCQVPVAAAVDLQQQALARHPLAPAALAWRTSSADRLHAGFGQDPAQRADRQLDVFPFGQQLGQMSSVDARVIIARQLDQALAQLLRRAVAGCSTEIAVDQCGQTLRVIARLLPADLTEGELEDARSFVGLMRPASTC
jgi:hypothetical protein